MTVILYLAWPSFDDDTVPVIFQQPRRGPPIPKGHSYLTIGWKQVMIPLCIPNTTYPLVRYG
jgi:hypothetical protein